MQTDLQLTHLALDLGTRSQRGHRVDHYHIDRTRAHQHVGDLQGLLAGVGLADQQIIDIDAEFLGVDRIECMLGIDEGRRAAHLLALGDHLEGERGLARRLRSVDFDDPTTRQAADTERDVERQRTGAVDLGSLTAAVTHAHDRALAELLLDLTERRRQGSLLVLVHAATSLYGLTE